MCLPLGSESQIGAMKETHMATKLKASFFPAEGFYFFVHLAPLNKEKSCTNTTYSFNRHHFPIFNHIVSSLENFLLQLKRYSVPRKIVGRDLYNYGFLVIREPYT